ncbi:ABC transporter substrate-binding protein [Actinopolymorpha sp. B11F2]|uniref:ABC transporter substrate-binding protein n=1 Tax=Actinopolymorpha sp. B11F2 TaxID=3160862 RepID=UPI0032E495A6
MLAGLCVLFLLAACTRGTTPSVNGNRPGQPERGGTLNMLGSGDVDYMDPNVSYYSIGYLGLRMWSRQFFTYPAKEGRSTSAVPDLATTLPSKANGGISGDGKTYTITIRDGAKWNTDPQRQVTAADAVRGLKRTCNPIQPFGGIPNFRDLIVGYAAFCDGFARVPQNAKAISDYINKNDISGVTAKTERTIVFTLTHPATYFVDMLTLPAFSPAPVEFLRYAPASRQLAQNTISNGPYQITSYTPTKRIEFERNPAWDPASDPVRKAYVDQIVVDQTVSQESTQQQLQTASAGADMEWDNYPPPSALPGLIARQDPNLHLGPTGSTNPYLVFNTLSPNNGKALTKPVVRQAIAYAIHRGNLIQALGGPKVNRPLTHVLPSTILGSTNFNLYPYNPGNTRKLFEKAKVPPGITLKMLYRNESEGGRKVFATLQQNLQEVGIRLVGVAVPNADFYTKYVQVPTVARRGVWDIALASWGPDWYGNAALSFFGPLFAGATSYPPTGSNFGFYTSKATNRLVQLAATATTPEEAATLWAQADRQVMKEAPVYPITNPLQPNYHASQVRNAVYIPALQNFDPTNVWLEPGRRGG